MLNVLLGLLPVLVLGLSLYVGALTLLTFRRLTRPPRRTYAWAVAKGLPGEPGELTRPRPFERFEFGRDGTTLVGWSIEGDTPHGPVVVLTHGWADSKVGGLGRVEAVAPLASRVVSWDLRGHGESGGTSTLGLLEKADLLALLDTLESGTSIVLFGWSLGAGVSIAAAVECDRVVGVIAESPYRLATTPARNVLEARAMPWRVNLPLALRLVGPGAEWRRFDRCVIAARLSVPLLVIHGEADRISPVEDGRDIAAAGRGEFVPLAAGHNDVWTGGDREKAEHAVCAFLGRAWRRP
ncbi:MAG: lysophospholipase [Phycisphaerales bacterium]|nr:lysophospholipase [Phycisphaerales bacterium]